VSVLFILLLLSAASVEIVEPVNGETYNGDWLTVRAIVENENTVPDSVLFALNGGSPSLLPRLNTDWTTYMQNELHHGFSQSPAPKDSTVLWTAAVTGDYHEFASPVIANGIVYQPSNLGTDSLYALDSATGELIWKYCIGTNDDAVTVKNNRLYVSGDSLWCLDATTGARIWGSPSATLFGGTPVLSEGKVYCGYSAETGAWFSKVCCLNADDGSTLWTASLPGCLGSCMLCSEGILYVPVRILAGGGCLFALNSLTGAVLWENTDSHSGFWDSSPVLVDSIIYINAMNRSAYAIHYTTGVTLWSRLIAEGYVITATPAYHDGKLFFADQYDSFYCLNAVNGDVIWSVPGTQHGSSAIADNLVFYGEKYNSDGASVIALSCETGDMVWSYRTGSTRIRSSPAITDGVMYIAGEDWNLYAFGTGLKYTYLDDLYTPIGTNELIVTAFSSGNPVAADTITFTVTGSGISIKPSRLFNLAATPNPFFSTAAVSFELDQAGSVSIRIYDLTGRSVTSLVNRELLQGEHSFSWNGCNDSGQIASPGLYLCRIEAAGIAETIGLCLLK